MSQVKVTVLMTLYNKAPFVAEAARSVLDGSFTDLELLVVDDASTDGGPEVVLALNDPRVRLVRNERNSGRAASANRGYDEARGEYVAILDADDVQHPDRLRLQVAFMDAHPEVGICGTGARYFGARSGESFWPATDAGCRGRLLFTDPVLYGSCMMRRSVMETHGLRSNANWTLPAEDYLFTITWSAHAQYANLPQVLVDYRIGEQNQRHGRDPVADRAAVCREVFRYFGIALSEEELDVHLLLHQLVRCPVDASLARRLAHWEQELLDRAGACGRFPMDVFRAEVRRRCTKAFHLLADRDLGAAMAHMRQFGTPPVAALKYLVVATLKRWTLPQRSPQR